MTKNLKEITKDFQLELSCFNYEFNKVISESKVPLLKHILKYIFNTRGKQIRPLFVILTSGLCGEINDKTYKFSVLIELLHTATLIHDDVVDNAEMRRSFFSVNALWKNKAAVLVGDYLLAKGLLIALENNYFEMLKIVSKATTLMCEGELLQIKKNKSLNTISEDTYYEIIQMKTASLFAVSFQAGAYAANADINAQNKLFEIGNKIGMAFQIKDDLLDFSEKNTGKNRLADLREEKFTLPLIYALNNSSLVEKIKYLNMIKSNKKKNNFEKAIIDWINEKNGFLYAENKLNEYLNSAQQELVSFPNNKYKQGILEILEFFRIRDY